MPLTIERELSPTPYAEVGRPTGVHRAPGLLAITSEFDSLDWPGRACYPGHQLRHRVSVYRAETAVRIAVFDGARHLINDLAFHPTRPWIAVATGSYDGGYSFEGELLIWDFEENVWWVVLSENREVRRCRFRHDGSLQIEVPPFNDQEHADAFDIAFRGVLTDLSPYRDLGLRRRDPDPRVAGFALGALDPERTDDVQEQLLALGAEVRHRVWDVAWLDDERLLAVHDRCKAEMWTTGGERSMDLRTDERSHGVQILRHGETTYVHVVHRFPDRSDLFALRDGTLDPFHSFDHAVSCSIDRSGRVLARDTRHDRAAVRFDLVLDASGAVVWQGDLGHYDCFNHHVRVDGGDALYFLRGTPPSQHLHKVLCCLDRDFATQEVVRWDDVGDGHLVVGDARLLADGALLRAYRIDHPRAGLADGCLDVLERPSNRRRFVKGMDGVAVALAPMAQDKVAFALTDGRLGVLDTRDGTVPKDRMLEIDGAPTVAISLAARGDRLAVGTIDGRLLLMRWRAP